MRALSFRFHLPLLTPLLWQTTTSNVSCLTTNACLRPPSLRHFLITRIITSVAPVSGNAPAAFSLSPSRGRTRVSDMLYIGYTLLEKDRTIWIPRRLSIADCNAIRIPIKMVHNQRKRKELGQTKHGPRGKHQQRRRDGFFPRLVNPNRVSVKESSESESYWPISVCEQRAEGALVCPAVLL